MKAEYGVTYDQFIAVIRCIASRGSVQLAAGARCVFEVEGEHVKPLKVNLSRNPDPLPFDITTESLLVDGFAVQTARVVWTERRRPARRRRGARQRCRGMVGWLMDQAEPQTRKPDPPALQRRLTASPRAVKSHHQRLDQRRPHRG